MALVRFRAKRALPDLAGGIIKNGEEFVAEENDPRAMGGRAVLLGPVNPPDEVVPALDSLADAATVPAKKPRRKKAEPAPEAPAPETDDNGADGPALGS